MAVIALSLMLLVWGVAVILMTFGTWRAMTFLHRGRKPVVTDQNYLPVTILKPLKGIDADVEENLESFFLLSYPKFELLFSVANDTDPVIPIVTRLIERHPKVDARLFIGAVEFGPNPKINNLIQSYDQAKYEWVLISDSNTRFSRDHLSRLARQFKNGISMQTSVVAGVDAKGLGGQLEAVFLNTVYARSMVTLAAVGFPCVMGKAMMFRKSVMDKTRGLRSLTKHIAEDYAAGRKFQLLGHQVQLSQNPVPQHIGTSSVAAFWSRHIRWGRIRKMQAPYTFIIEPLFSSILSGCLGAVAFSQMLGFPPAIFLALHFGFWFACDVLVANAVGDPLDWKFLPVWTLRELIHLPLWTHISMGSTIQWRGQKIRLKKATILETRAEAREYAASELRKSV